jgi:mercuric ion transport protein
VKEKPVILASIGAAIAASLCCIGPLAAVVLGLGAFGAASVFETLRPYLLGLTFALLAGAFYLVYRPAKAGDCAEGECSVESPSRSTRAMLWLATILVLLFASFPYYSGLVRETLAQSSASNARIHTLHERNKALSAVALDVTGMTCGGCATAVESALAGLKGVQKASVSFEQKRAVVTFDPSQVTPDRLLQAVEKAGFKAQVRP